MTNKHVCLCALVYLCTLYVHTHMCMCQVCVLDGEVCEVMHM